MAAAAAGTMAIGAAAAASAITLGLATVGIIASISAIASSISDAKKQVAQPPQTKFASGGIVGGNSLAGDNMKINANSGEMVLNRRQQAKLFNMINNGGGGGDIQLTANLIMDDKQFALAVASVDKKSSNRVGDERRINNRPLQ